MKLNAESEDNRKNDIISHPAHYCHGRYEPKDVIRDWHLNFNLGNVVKYIARAGHKDDILQDLKKARQYLDFEIEALEEENTIYRNTVKELESIVNALQDIQTSTSRIDCSSDVEENLIENSRDCIGDAIDDIYCAVDDLKTIEEL